MYALLFAFVQKSPIILKIVVSSFYRWLLVCRLLTDANNRELLHLKKIAVIKKLKSNKINCGVDKPMHCSMEHRVVCSTLYKGVGQQESCWLWLIDCEHNCGDSVSARRRVCIRTQWVSSFSDVCTSRRALSVETHFWFRNRTSACVRINHWRESCALC